MFSSKTDQWATPQDFFDNLNAEFDFTLDVAADSTNHKCANYYSKEVDGLSQSWNVPAGGGVFCNPPYGREIGLWVKKAYEESLNGQLIVMLLPARTDTKWFHDYILNKAEIRFVRGRLKFGDSNNSAPFPSMVVVYNRPENNSKAVLSELRNERTRIYNNFDGKPM